MSGGRDRGEPQRAVEELGELPVFPSLGNRKSDWYSFPWCHCFPPLLSGSGESQSLKRHSRVRLGYDER